MKAVKVENMRSSKGNLVPNQFIITTKDATYFQSYNSLIAKISKRNGRIYLDPFYWDYSRTTSKYLYSFLGEFYRYGLNKKEIQKMSADYESIIQFKDLN